MVSKSAYFRDLVIRGHFSHQVLKELPRSFAQLLVHDKSTWLNEEQLET